MSWRSNFARAGVKLAALPPEQRDPGAALLMPGDTAKLPFALINPPDPHTLGETMWVTVTQRGSDGHYAGLLVSEPYYLKLAPGTEVFFSPEHVLEVWSESDQTVSPGVHQA